MSAVPQRTPSVPSQDLSAFSDRHLGPTSSEMDKMLAALGVPTIEALLDEVVPDSIRVREPLSLAAPLSETEALDRFARRQQGGHRL